MDNGITEKNSAGAPRLSCSVGIMAHNEERNIAHVLERLLSQDLASVRISEIIVVASGCTDSTERLVKDISNNNPTVKLVSEPSRTGKASAVNIFLAEASGEFIVITGADTLPDKHCVERLVLALEPEENGMAGAHPIPLNPKDSFTGYVVHFLWDMHHQLSLKRPKCGEMVAFRRVFDSLPPDTIVDEPQMEALVKQRGLRVVYEPEAIVFNLGPDSLREIIMRRSSIIAGYIRLARRTPYRVSTQRLRWWLIAHVLRKVVSREEPALKVFGAVMVELASRIIGSFQAKFSRKPLHLWQPAESSKSPADKIRT